MGQHHRPPTRRQILPMDEANSLEVLFQIRALAFRNQRAAILTTFAIPYDQLLSRNASNRFAEAPGYRRSPLP